MQDAALVRGGEARRRSGARSRAPCPAGSRPMRRSSDAEVLAVDVLHREERAGRRPRRCRRRGRRSGARPGARCALRCGSCVEARRVVGDVGGQELQRDRLAELQVVGAVDLAHAAAAEQADDAVAAGEQGAGREAPVRIARQNPRDRGHAGPRHGARRLGSGGELRRRRTTFGIHGVLDCAVILRRYSTGLITREPTASSAGRKRVEHRFVVVGADDRAARSGEVRAGAARARGVDHLHLPRRAA